MNYAIIIGINHYKKRALEGAVNDANKFKNWLLRTEKILLEHKPYLHLLQSSTNDRVAMDRDVDLAVAEIEEDIRMNHLTETNRLYFYFSGHGLGIKWGETALCMRMYPTLRHANISSELYCTALKNLGVFDEIFMLLDCCRDEDPITEANRPSFGGDIVIPRPHGNHTKIFVAYGCNYGGSSFEVYSEDPITNEMTAKGLFTEFMIKALDGDASPPGSLEVTGRNLKEHIKKNFQSYAESHKKVQVGMGAGDDGLVINVLPLAAVPYNYEVIFTKDRTVEVADGSLEVLDAYSGPFEKGESLPMHLERGVTIIRDINSGEIKYLTNHNPNVKTKDEF